MDRTTQAVLDWINARRLWLGRPELEQLLPVEEHPDPITESLGADWCLGTLQTFARGRVVQYDPPDSVHRLLARWRAGHYPDLGDHT